MKYFFKTQLGETRYELADGSLLCVDVPIARTGEYVYHSSELPKDLIPDDNGMIKVFRTDDEVFSPATMASFEGATFTINHPEEDVNPSNWEEYAKGHSQNVRRGKGEKENLLLADILVKKAEAIAEIYKGVIEISCGYDARYHTTGKGIAKQTNIVGNHVALVTDGRAGSTCSIGDSKMTIKKGWLQTLFSASKTNDANLMKMAIDNIPGDVVDSEPEPGKVPVQDNGEHKPKQDLVTDSELTLEAISNLIDEKIKKALAKTNDGEPKPGDNPKTNDAAYTADALARAEIILPGINLPKTMSGTEFKREVLSTALKTVDGATLLSGFVGDSGLAGLSDHAVDVIFTSASEIKKHTNGKQSLQTPTKDNGIIRDPEELNEFFARFYKGDKK